MINNETEQYVNMRRAEIALMDHKDVRELKEVAPDNLIFKC